MPVLTEEQFSEIREVGVCRRGRDHCREIPDERELPGVGTGFG